MLINLGPFLRKELVVLSRRRRTFWMRAGALAILSILMIPLLVQLLVQSQRGHSVKGVAEFLFQLFVWTQFALVFVAAPAFSAGTISYERRLGMVDLLRLAAIRAPTLTLGKFLGAAALPFLLVLSEVPFLFVWSLFGGVAPEAILATLVLTATITTLFISFGLFTSAVSHTAGIATVVSYLVALIYLFAPLWGDPFFPAGFEGWLVHVSLARVLNSGGLVAVPWLRPVWSSLVLSIGFVLAASVFLMQPPSVARVLDRTSLGSGAHRRSRRVWPWPVLWREIYCGGGRRVTTFLNIVTGFSIACLAVAATVEDDAVRWWVGGITLVLPPIAGGVLGSIAVTLEKEGGSIAALLLTPSAATSVVLGKFAGACARTMPLAFVPFLLGFVRLEQIWMWLSLTSGLAALLLISSGTLFSVIFAKSAVAVAVTFGGTIVYGFCCCNVLGWFPAMMIMPNAEFAARIVWLLISIGVYAVIVATVLAVAVGVFESRARDAIAAS